MDHETKNRPHGCHGQTQPKDDPTYQVSCGRRGRTESGEAGEGHQGNGPRCRRQEKLVQTLPRAQNAAWRLRDPPFHRSRQAKLPLPAPARHQVTEPRDLGVEGTNIGHACESVWEASWRLATADVPTEILGTCLAGRIVPACKPNGGVRPFAIGQVIRRLVCKATAKLLTKKVRSMTSPHQFAVWMKQGPELLHKIVSAHVAIHRDAAMASVDVKNAHGAVERESHPV